MPEQERDVATATRPAIDPAYTAQTAQVPARIEQQQARIVQLDERGPLVLSPEQIDLVKRTIAKGATDDELDLFLYQCKVTRLNPLTRQCYFMRRTSWDKKLKRNVESFTFETSIDGFRLIAERTGKYAGQVAPQWADVTQSDHGVVTTWYEVWPYPERTPYAARVGVLRRDFDAPLFAVARWDAYVQTVDIWENDRKTDKKRLNAMWEKRGAEQLAKCAESLALRQAFPNELSGVYSTEEMAGQRDDDDEPHETREQPRQATKREPRQATKRSAAESSKASKAAPEIFGGRSVTRYPTRFPFSQAKGVEFDRNQLDKDQQPIPREYVVSSDLLARAYEWVERALQGKQTIDELIDGKKTGKKLPLQLDDAKRVHFDQMHNDIGTEIERRAFERDEAIAASERAAKRAPAEAMPVTDAELIAADAVIEDDDKGEAYEGD